MQKAVYVYSNGTWPTTPTEVQRFVYNGWNPVLVLDANNVTKRKYTWGLDLSGTIHGAGGIGGLLACEEPQTTGGPKKYWFMYDANGNVGQVLDATDTNSITIAAHYEYDPYGNVINNLSSYTYATANPFRFSTKWFDVETGMYYYGYRYYLPQVGRWGSRDPIEEEGGVNLYVGFGNSPTLCIDPIGLRSILSRRRPISGFMFDQAGVEIFSRWLFGDGSTWEINNDPLWSEYMKENTLLPSQIRKELEADARLRLTGQRKGSVGIRFAAVIENGYLTGYEMLHGTDKTVGNFFIYGQAPELVVDSTGGCTYRYKVLSFVWNDIIDPNKKYGTDVALAAFFKKIANPKDYTIHILWQNKKPVDIEVTPKVQGQGAYPYE